LVVKWSISSGLDLILGCVTCAIDDGERKQRKVGEDRGFIDNERRQSSAELEIKSTCNTPPSPPPQIVCNSGPQSTDVLPYETPPSRGPTIASNYEGRVMTVVYCGCCTPHQSFGSELEWVEIGRRFEQD
jgi:hypothetical protein